MGDHPTIAPRRVAWPAGDFIVGSSQRARWLRYLAEKPAQEERDAREQGAIAAAVEGVIP